MSAIVHVATYWPAGQRHFRKSSDHSRETRQTVTLIAPSPDTCTMPVAKTVMSGGGGGGDHDPIPVPKGHPPKAALQQITPPAIVMRNEKPRLAVEPTVVAPPTLTSQIITCPNIGTSSAVPSCRRSAVKRPGIGRRYWIWIRGRSRRRSWTRNRCGQRRWNRGRSL